MPNKKTSDYYIPAYMGTTYSNLIQWCNTFFQEAPPYLANLNINAMDFDVATGGFETFRILFTCRNNVNTYSKELTQELHDLMFKSGEPVIIATTVPGLTPATAYNGLGGFIVRINNWWVHNIQTSPAYTVEIGKLLGFIHASGSAPDLLSLSPDAVAKFTGGAVVLHGHLPKPAKYWHLLVDRGHGKVELALIAGAKFTDHHPLPDKPAAWTYTVELRDKDQYAIGKVSVVSVTVWHGAADQGPEAGA
ncbi:MAG: hypothetical protein LBD30_01235 [Verrucomicrobiales bacterium]|jgi:hypothetical protein|nr:hypothetical protein [Verrucomicrobiales bacterium]